MPPRIVPQSSGGERGGVLHRASASGTDEVHCPRSTARLQFEAAESSSLVALQPAWSSSGGRHGPVPGRDHWDHCMAALFAGGGIRGGQDYTASSTGSVPTRSANPSCQKTFREQSIARSALTAVWITLTVMADASACLPMATFSPCSEHATMVTRPALRGASERRMRTSLWRFAHV